MKQHAFIAALELASARTRLGPDEHLDAAAERWRRCSASSVRSSSACGPPQRQLVPALHDHLADWSRRTGVATDLTVHPTLVEQLPAEPLLPVALEALTNIARHAGAHRVAVMLSQAADRAVLEVTDDGHGFDLGTTPFGQGLRGMRERLVERGGTLDVRSGRGGTTITAHYPVAEP